MVTTLRHGRPPPRGAYGEKTTREDPHGISTPNVNGWGLMIPDPWVQQTVLRGFQLELISPRQCPASGKNRRFGKIRKDFRPLPGDLPASQQSGHPPSVAQGCDPHVHHLPDDIEEWGVATNTQSEVAEQVHRSQALLMESLAAVLRERSRGWWGRPWSYRIPTSRYQSILHTGGDLVLYNNIPTSSAAFCSACPRPPWQSPE